MLLFPELATEKNKARAIQVNTHHHPWVFAKALPFGGMPRRIVYARNHYYAVGLHMVAISVEEPHPLAGYCVVQHQ